MILVVDDLKEFHKQNIEMNKKDYRVIVRFIKSIAVWAQNYGTKIHFNTFQNDDCVSFSNLIEDLIWSYWQKRFDKRSLDLGVIGRLILHDETYQNS